MALDEATALQLARDAYSASTSYFDSSIRRDVEGNLRRFQGVHPSGSKYHSDAYKAKSRIFRPKTRSSLRKHEAVAAEALFSNQDVVSIDPQDDSDPMQQASADLHRELLRFRLKRTIPWFQTVMGAYQETLNVGIVCSYQHWCYDEQRGKDYPEVRLVPIENVRFDPGASWIDPVGTSPYFIELIPMYVKDVEARMQQDDAKTGEAKWKPLTKAEILQGVKGYSDSIRLQREQGRTDSKENTIAVTSYTLVWVHKNIVEHDGIDYCFYTLGDQQMLSSPVPLKQRYHHGQRPYVIGYCTIEAHKNYPASPNHLGKDVQAEINEVANQRIENIKLVLAKRFLVGRSRRVDIRSLTRNVAGSATLVDDTEKDVKPLEFQDVTSSAYKEQEVLNLDHDEATGNFSQSSVQSNRRMNETVGGMELLSTDANQVGNYQLRIFVETWVEPVLRQLVLLEQKYETDEVILALAGKKAKLDEDFSAITDELIEQELILTVNVGFGATSPQRRINDLLLAMRALKEMLVDGVLTQYGLKFEEVSKEVFAGLGYRDGTRFFDMASEDPRVQQLMAQIEELTRKLESKAPPPELLEAQVAEVRARAVKTGVDATFSAMQAAEVVAAVPQAAPVADALLQGAGYRPPTPPGVDPNIPLATASGAPPDAPTSAAAAVAPAGGVPPVTPNEVSGGAPGDTSPNTPANPRSPGTGAAKGIETQRSDSVGLADGGMVGLDDEEERRRLERDNRRLYPEAYGAPAIVGPTINGLTDDTNRELGLDPMNPFAQRPRRSRSPLASLAYGYANGGMVRRYADGGYVSVLERGDMASPAYRASLEQRQALQPVLPEAQLIGPLRSMAGVARAVLAPRTAARGMVPEGYIGSQPGAGFPTAPNTPNTLGEADQMVGSAIRGTLFNGAQDYERARQTFDNTVENYRQQPARYADGGLIQGPGTGTSDSIPAVNVDTGDKLAVSNGEWKVSVAVVQALGKDFFDELIAKYHKPVQGQAPIYQADAPFDTPLGMETGNIILPADVVEGVSRDFGADFLPQLERLYGGAQ